VDEGASCGRRVVESSDMFGNDDGECCGCMDIDVRWLWLERMLALSEAGYWSYCECIEFSYELVRPVLASEYCDVCCGGRGGGGSCELFSCGR